MSAGYLFSVANKGPGIIEQIVREGTYAVLTSTKWTNPVASTLGDYLTMKPGDNVYFFSDRTIYGIGEIVDVLGNGDGAFQLFQGATSKKANPPDSSIICEGEKRRIKRWAIVFKPSPFFFTEGVDMDDLLLSNPDAFKSLRTFWERSFIQFDDAENLAFMTAILRANQAFLNNPEQHPDQLMAYDCTQSLSTMTSSINPSPIDLSQIVLESKGRNGAISSEMIIEDVLIYGLKHHLDNTKLFGSWDYIAHQVPASPFKPIKYMDRIDIFGYRWLPGYEGKIISKFLVVELKKGPAVISNSATKKDYDQLMKYVDWVCDQYAHGDYSMVEAYLVAHSFDFTEEQYPVIDQAITRNYVMGHFATSHQWKELCFVTYQADENGGINFSIY